MAYFPCQRAAGYSEADQRRTSRPRLRIWKMNRFILIPIMGGLLTLSAAAQTPRDMATLANGAGPAIDPAVATHLELSVVVFENDTNESIQISLSDGRGLTWTPSMRIDQGTFSAKQLNDDSVAVFDDNIYVYWLDDRLAETEIYFNYSTDRGLTFQPFDIKVNKGFMTDAVTTARMAVDPRSVSPTDDLVVFLISAYNASTGMEELYLNYSMDSGMTFLGAPIPFTFHNLLADIDAIDLAVEGGLIYGIWQDNFYSFMPDLDDVMFSAYDPFLGNFFFQDVMLNTNFPSTAGFDVEDELVLDVDGGTIAVIFQVEEPLGDPEKLVANLTTTGGLIWTGDILVGNYTVGVHDVDTPDVTITPSGDIVLVWLDDRVGMNNAFRSTSFDGGLTYVADSMMSTMGAAGPTVLAKGDTVVASWCSGGPPRFCESSWSKDQSVIWDPQVKVSNNVSDTEAPVFAFNEKYMNYIHAWSADDVGITDIYVGGFRQQTLQQTGNAYIPGSPVSFQVQHWPEAGNGWLFAVLLSRTPGDYFLSNNLNLGLLRDGYFTTSLNMAKAGLLSGVISATGDGTTVTLNAPPFLPFPLYAVGLAAETNGMIGQVTDFIQVQ